MPEYGQFGLGHLAPRGCAVRLELLDRVQERRPRHRPPAGLPGHPAAGELTPGEIQRVDAIARRTEITAIRNNALVDVIAYPAELTDR